MGEIELVNIAIDNLNNANGIIGKYNVANNKDLDGVIEFDIQGKKVRVPIKVKKELRHHHIQEIINRNQFLNPIMVVATNIFPKIKEELRLNNIGYLDTMGNFYLKTENILIWIEGNKKTAIKKDNLNRAFIKTGLKVIFNILENGELINLPYREIARITEIGLGNVNNILKGLIETGFLIKIDKDHYKLTNKKELLDRWIIGYAERLKPTLELGTYRFVNNIDFAKWKQLPTKTIKNEDIYWGGEPAGNLLTKYLNPQILTIYTDKLPQSLMRYLKLYPDPNGNVKMYKKFWQFETEEVAITPTLLVYTDLINTGDSRCIETAKEIYDKFLKDKYE